MGLLVFLFLFAWSAFGTQVQVVGSRALRATALQERIQSKIGAGPIQDRQLEQLRFQILGLYRRVGFIDARLDWSTPKPNQLVCKIEEGHQILVRDIQVTGGQYFSNEALKNRIVDDVKSEPIESGLLEFGRIEINSILNPVKLDKKKSGFVFFDDKYLPFYKSLFIKAKETIEDLYLDNGFLEVQVFGPKESEISADHWITLEFRVEEGAQTRVSKIELIGAEAQVKNPAIKLGDPLNPNWVEEYRSQLEEFFWNEGYPHAEISSQIRGSEVIYQINPGDRVQIEDVVISGNIVTKKEIIQNRLKIKVGDWYSLEKITESRSQILQTDLFSEVQISIDGTNLLINVKERERNTLEFGFGASFVDGPRVTGIWQYRNIFGLGISFRTRTQLNYPALFYDMPLFYPTQYRDALKAQTSNYFAGRVSAGFLYPKMLAIPFDVDGSIDVGLIRDLKPAYVLESVNSQLSFFSQFTKSLRLTTQLELEYSDFTGSPNTAIRVDQGVVKQATPKLLLLLDQRDNFLLPKKGYAVELNFDYGVGGKAETSISYIKLLAGMTTYLPLMKKLTWVMNARAGGIWDVGEGTYVPIFKRFYLGGTSSIRGFSDYQIFPVDANSTSGVSLGGNYFVLLRNEVQFPIVGDLRGGIFIDAGELMQDVRNFSFPKVAVGTGFGIRYETPIGPLMFDLGIRVFDGNRIDRSNFANLFQLHFSIGNSI